MNTDRGGRYSVLSIYLPILAIIVLISIRGGREVRGASDDSNPHDAAALLVTEDFLNERGCTTEKVIISGYEHPRIIVDTRQGKTNSTRVKQSHSGTHLTAIIVDNVRHKVASYGVDGKYDDGFKDGWISIMPGWHVIEVEMSCLDDLVRDPIWLAGCDDPMADGTVIETKTNVVPQGVYLLSLRVDQHTIKTKGSRWEARSYCVIDRLADSYDHSLGVVTDPTDSKFSFRIK